MSLIQCPECGQEISDKAKKCIHCGAELFHCPECGKVTVSRGNTCPNCGYELPATPKPASAAKPQTAPNPASKTGLVKAWAAACPETEKKRKVLGVVNFLIKLTMMIPELILMFHMFGSIYPLNSKTSPLELINCKNFINNIFTAAVILSCTVAVVSFVIQYWRIFPIKKWLEQGTFDIDGYLQSKDAFSSGKDDEGHWAIYCMRSPQGKIYWGLSCFLKSIELLLDPIIFCKILQDLALDRWESMVLGTKFTVTIPWAPIVAFVAIFLILEIVSLILAHVCKKFLKSHIQGEQQS